MYNNFVMYIGEGKYIRKNGGVGSHGHCVVELLPTERASGISFISTVNNACIPDKFISSIKSGVMEALNEGFLIQHPITDLQISLIGGSYHDVDSKPEDFKQAAKLAVKDACAKSPMTVLEPMANFEITSPSEYIGDIVSDISKRRGQIVNIDTNVINAKVPVAESFGYATDLRSMTQGRASFTNTPCGYEEVPAHILDGLKLNQKTN